MNENHLNPMQTHGACSWIEFNSPHKTEALHFYRKVLDWEIIEMPMQDGSTYSGIGLNGQHIGGFSDIKPELKGWLIYITVDDVDKRLALARENEAEVLAEAFDAPGVGRMAIIRDAFGAQIAFIRYATPENT